MNPDLNVEPHSAIEVKLVNGDVFKLAVCEVSWLATDGKPEERFAWVTEDGERVSDGPYLGGATGLGFHEYDLTPMGEGRVKRLVRFWEDPVSLPELGIVAAESPLFNAYLRQLAKEGKEVTADFQGFAGHGAVRDISVDGKVFYVGVSRVFADQVMTINFLTNPRPTIQVKKPGDEGWRKS